MLYLGFEDVFFSPQKNASANRKSAKRKKEWVRRSKIHNCHTCVINKFLSPKICGLLILFADHPPLVNLRTGKKSNKQKGKVKIVNFVKKSGYQLNDLQRIRLSRHQKPDRRYLGKLRKRDNWGRGGRGEEPNNTTMRKPCPL